jgi:uncharacterized membrane protein
MRVPVELKLAGVALFALAGLVFGWRQRQARRVFALSVQGGAIGVLLMVVFAAARLVQPALLPDGVAFAISVVLVAACAVLAVRQDALALAVFALLAAFLAPLWLSTGQGNHVALFSYYALVDAGIVAIAWFRAWRLLNVLAFAFTFGIGTLWGVLRYRPEQFASTEPFLLLFFAFFLAIPILFVRLRPPGRRDLVDGCLLFGTPLVAFSLQAALLEGERMQLAYCALGLAAIYALLAWWLRRAARFQPLVAPYAVLAFGFATLAVPLALSAQATACVFALEGAAVAWLGVRQQRRLPQLAGAALQVLAAASFFAGAPYVADQPLLNAGFMGAGLLALAGFAAAWTYRGRDDAPSWPALPYYLWGLLWWLRAVGIEIDTFVADAYQPAAWLAVLAVTGLLAAEAFRRDPAPALAVTVVAAMACGIPLALWSDSQPLAGWGAAAWAVYAVAGYRAVSGLRTSTDAALPWAHMAWWGALALVVSLSLRRFAFDVQLGLGWQWAGLLLPWLLLASATLLRPAWVRAPGGSRFAEWRSAQGTTLLALLGAGAIAALGSSADPAPLPWLPLLNPLELVQLAALALALWWMRQAGTFSPRHAAALSAAAFVFLTVVALRATHHWGGAAWDPDMLDSGLVQTTLTVLWSVLGVIGWIVGSRRGQRMVWLGGALLMAVVLAKLVLVDREHLGNLLGIVSFLAYGLLCTAVGYFAPVPPRRAAFAQEVPA